MHLRADPDPELLLAHSAWIRSLARRMAGADAEDLVQETWLAALERPRSEVRSLRGWLAGVLTNLARQTRRGEARRRIREQRSAGGATSEPSVAETFEAASTGRELADLVLALEEPFRTAVLLRFYEGLPPRRIAQRLDIPVRTVNSRLTRGLERLREQEAARVRGGPPRGRPGRTRSSCWQDRLSGSVSGMQFPLVEGRSDSLGVEDQARTLVLLKNGVEVLRVPLALRPGTLNLITP